MVRTLWEKMWEEDKALGGTIVYIIAVYSRVVLQNFFILLQSPANIKMIAMTLLYAIIHIIILVSGILVFYYLIKDYLKGNCRILLYAFLLLFWGNIMEFSLKYKEITINIIANSMMNIVLSYVAALLAAVIFYRWKSLQKEIFIPIFIIVELVLYALLFLAGVGPDGTGNSGVKTSIVIPGVGMTVQLIEGIKVLYFVIIVGLLCKYELKKNKEYFGIRLLTSIIITLVNIAFMVALSEMGTMLIMLLVYCVFIIIYVKAFLPKCIIVALSAVILGIIIGFGQENISHTNRSITAQEAVDVFFKLQPRATGYNGPAIGGRYYYKDLQDQKRKEKIEVNGTIDSFRTATIEFINNKCTGKASLTKEEIIDTLKKYYPENGEDDSEKKKVIEAAEDLFAGTENSISWEELSTSLKESRNRCLSISIVMILRDKDLRKAYLDTYFFSKVYYNYANVLEKGGLLRKFYLPKYTKIKSRYYIWRHRGWDPQNDGDQSRKAISLIKKGGFFGKAEAITAEDSISVAESDMVYAALILRFGWITGIILLVIFALLCREAVTLYDYTKTGFNRGIICAFSMSIWFQAIYTFASNCGALPIVGIPVPFISSGGTSKIICMAMIGVLILLSGVNMDVEIIEEPKSSRELLENIKNGLSFGRRRKQ